MNTSRATDPGAPGPDATDVARRAAAVGERIRAAARRAGRDPEAVTLVAVTKGHDAARVAAVLAAGIVDLGENRAQELVAKAAALEPGPATPRWHFVGRLQRNKVRALAPLVAAWHSVDRPELLAPLARHSPGARVLVQVDLAGEPQKGGCPPDEVDRLVDGVRRAGLVPVGLTCVPPFDDDPRPHFAALRTTAQRLGLAELSMGMSADFETAVEEGSTMVRIGTALVGPRRVAPGTRD